MRHRTWMAAGLAIAGLCTGAATDAAMAAAPSAAVAPAAAAASPAALVAATPASSTISFSVALKLADPAGARSFAESVSTPGSADYGQYLTASQWEERFSPSEASVAQVSAWLKATGAKVLSVSPDRMTIHASASAATVEKAFGTSLGQYRVHGADLRLASSSLRAPTAVASLISGVLGVSQAIARPADTTGEAMQAHKVSGKGEPIPAPEGFRSATPCSKYWAQKLDTTDPAYGGGFPEPLPYTPCGYTPPQLQGAYSLSGPIAAGDDGKGVTVAIVDAYAASTLYQDAHEYSERNQPEQVLEPSQFKEKINKPFVEEELCEAPGWSGEQSLDVEAVHAMAPGAKILFVGASSCLDEGLYEAEQEIVDNGWASIVSNSWLGNFGELLEETGAREAFDDIAVMADGTGIGLQFASGDEGDDYKPVGMDAANYPASSPFVTAVGGTSLAIGKYDERLGEWGWSTGRSVLCTTSLEAIEYPGCSSSTLSSWLPPAPGEYDYGGGGGTAYYYPEPSYQEGVVPAALALRNSGITGERNRVVPDISMDADPSTGLLIGETQAFPNGTYYDEYRLGGTSLATPLFSGLLADADQALGKKKSLGFVNPLIYKLDEVPATASRSFFDVTPGGKQAMARVDYLDGVDSKYGDLISARTIEYEGKQEYCDETGSCEKQKNILSTTPGFDSMTGIGTPGEGLIAELANP